MCLVILKLEHSRSLPLDSSTSAYKSQTLGYFLRNKGIIPEWSENTIWLRKLNMKRIRRKTGEQQVLFVQLLRKCKYLFGFSSSSNSFGIPFLVFVILVIIGYVAQVEFSCGYARKMNEIHICRTHFISLEVDEGHRTNDHTKQPTYLSVDAVDNNVNIALRIERRDFFNIWSFIRTLGLFYIMSWRTSGLLCILYTVYSC